MGLFSTSKLVRRNTQNVVEKQAQADIDPKDPTVVGKVTKGECQMLNRVLLGSTTMPGNLDAVPHSCTEGAEGDAPTTHRASWMFSFLARRATQSPHAVQWPEGSIRSHPEEHIVGGGDITKGECSVLAKHLATTFGTLGLLPKACEGVINNSSEK
uniref:Uncharacterized protein n=1 Tax=Aureoumbra lagunensis TaxID=44058 RepID=A0A7S3NJW8_9STRA|mmetsp:Transcript_5294/g.7455  ORF Transcript_5294/g.7455 Transcript_5294/m.7455 type:complete len:156 (+) Transcript_5294:44-511(+)|eukprot:CAMPEP_0197285776 /NCGR_PEP_ID=MMETSP0890-20130614/1129_1 /TAXON_ID=44058 ORGANISM="Aureoumbra lagunensis, Strain CCMP1510" /NCGR_SAMPLE_ID=MMETSP0890 /ASSEMBLY_ACC=CAM_ASM_000533 /LENGTH=155 /DNA_ID=CAMNT_0042753593 /DNA_START=44 /DNA_END=511 /DNA_ORIENTATION=+